MLSLTLHAITGGLFAAIVMAIVGNILHDNGCILDSSTRKTPRA